MSGSLPDQMDWTPTVCRAFRCAGWAGLGSRTEGAWGAGSGCWPRKVTRLRVQSVSRVGAVEEGGSWGSQRLVSGSLRWWEASAGRAAVGVHLEGLPVAAGLGVSPWELCQNPQGRFLPQELGLCLSLHPG